MIQRLCTLYFPRKRLILLKKNDLSTEKTAFTITTIFIYRSIVNRQKKRKSGDIFKKHAKSISKKSQRQQRDPLPNRLPGITWMPTFAKEQRPWSLKLNCQTWLPNRDLSVRSTSNMPLQQENPWFLLAAVDKCLHIHRMTCGKSRSLSTAWFLSQTSPRSIQCLYAYFFVR